MDQTKRTSRLRALTALFAAALVACAIAALPQAAWASDTYSWSGSGSATESSGVITIEGDGTLTLTADTTATVYVKSGTVTIDLASYTLTQGSESSSAAPYKATVYVEIGATLTIKGESGTVQNSTTGSGSAAVFNNGTCAIESGTYKVTSSDGKAWYTIANHGTMTISGGTFTNLGAVSSSGSSLVENGYQSPNSSNALTGYVEGTNAQYPSLTITAGTFTSSSTVAVKNDERGVLSISGGTFSASGQSVQNWSEATISGGTFNQIVATWTYTGVVTSDGVDNPTTTITGGTFNRYIYVADSSSAGNTATVTISGSDTSAYGIYVASSATESADVTIYGGTFSTDVSEYVAESSAVATTTADGSTSYTVTAGAYVAKVTDADGNLTEAGYYATFEAAVAAVTSTYNTIVLVDDATVTSTTELYLSKNLATLDLGGYTLSFENDTVKTGLGVTGSGTKLTIKNGSIYDGRAVAEDRDSDSATGHYTFYVLRDVALTFEDVTITTKASDSVSSRVIWAESRDNLCATITLGEGTVISDVGSGIYVRGMSSDTTKTTLNVDGAEVYGSNTLINVGGTDVDGVEVNVTDGILKSTGTSAISLYCENDALTISGGYIGGSTVDIGTGGNTQQATVSVSGGYFSHTVSSSYIASGYVAATTDLENYGYTVSPLDIDFWGGSLRMSDWLFTGSTSTADLRFGFCWTGLPTDATVSSFGWYWSTSQYKLAAGNGKQKVGTTSREADPTTYSWDQSSTGTVANLVITNIPQASYGTTIYVEMYVSYKASDDVTVTVTLDEDSDGEVIGRSVQQIANCIVTNATDTSSNEYKYAVELGGTATTDSDATDDSDDTDSADDDEE